jgi:hypothetical protein
MSGLNKHLKKYQEALLNVKNIKKKFTKPSVSPGDTIWPKKPVEQAKYGFRWDLDVPVQIADNRPEAEEGATRDANRFKLQANAQAEPKSIKEWINKQGKKGTHADVTFVDIPIDVDDDEFKEIMDPDALADEID